MQFRTFLFVGHASIIQRVTHVNYYLWQDTFDPIKLNLIKKHLIFKSWIWRETIRIVAWKMEAFDSSMVHTVFYSVLSDGSVM